MRRRRKTEEKGEEEEVDGCGMATDGSLYQRIGADHDKQLLWIHKSHGHKRVGSIVFGDETWA